LRWTAGYGYEPWRAFYWALGVVMVGWFIFAQADKAERMVPAVERFYLDRDAYREYRLSGVLPDGYPNFRALTYSIDVFLPIVSFSQEEHWRPGNLGFLDQPKERWYDPRSWNWLRFYNRLHIILGWVLTTIAVLGFTGIIRKERE
jgi:hypothetical protein